MTWKPPVQLFVYAYETQIDIEYTIKKPIKTRCKSPHPQPNSPSTASTGRGGQDEKMWVKMAIGYHLSLKTLLRNVDVGFGGSRSQLVERSRLELADAFLGNSHFFAYFLER